jgi:predicted kinase
VSQSRPPLVIVSGAPGAGKTTLVTILADALRLPLLARDELKERLADVLLPEATTGAGIVDGVDSAALGRASYALLFSITERLVTGGAGVIIESNFRRGVAERELTPMV